MKSTSNDPRSIRTRDLLRQGLIQVVVEKPFRDITIKDITAQAKVNRATLYLHYDDKYDLLEDCAREMMEELRKDIAPFDELVISPSPTDHHRKRIMAILLHFQRHAEFFRAIYGKDGEPTFFTSLRNQVMETIHAMITDVMTRHNQPIDDDYLKMMVRFQSAGNLDVLLWWLENDMSMPLDVLADKLTYIMIPSIAYMVTGGNLPQDT